MNFLKNVGESVAAALSPLGKWRPLSFERSSLFDHSVRGRLVGTLPPSAPRSPWRNGDCPCPWGRPAVVASCQPLPCAAPPATQG